MAIDSTVISPFADGPLFGHDSTPGIIDLHLLPQTINSTQTMMRVYQRDPISQHLKTEDVPLYPFFFLANIALLQGFPRQRYRYKTLSGSNAYRYLIVFNTWQSHWEAVRYIKARSGKNEKRPETYYLIPDPAQQYLMQTGKTLFKDINFNDLHRLQLDIEVLASGDFPQAQRAEDCIIAIVLSDNRGWHEIIDSRSLSEPEMLHNLIALIQTQDPDVIEGHNIYAFTFAYILDRCQRYSISFAIGRDGSVPRSFTSSMRFAERTVEFPALDIAGRHIIDTYFQVMSFDVFKRDLPGYSLKVAVQYFGLAAENRTHIEGAHLARTWQSSPEQLLAYALDDVIETERLAYHLSGSTFYLTQILPMSYGKVARTGPAAKIEALLVRAYLRQRQALPLRQHHDDHSMRGGYTDIFFTGVLGPIVYADVESLYPSIMLNYDVKPASDTLGLFQHLLQQLTDMRLDTKRRMTEATAPAEQSALDAQQNSYKILINSFYGQLGFQRALFSDYAEADRVASTGQEILKAIIIEIRRANGTVIEVDTDGVLFVPPPDVSGEAAERLFVNQLNQTMPSGIRIGFDGRFQKMLSYKSKNYALLAYDGSLKLKGSSLVSRSIERFGRQFILDAIPLLLQENVQGLHDLYTATYDRIVQHDWDIMHFARTETLKDTVEHYQADVKRGRRSKAVTYELAIARMRETGQPIHQGDRITYYVTGSSPTVTTFDNARLSTHWNPTQPDENSAYYLKRLNDLARKFAPFFSPADFQRVLAPNDLFGFSAAGIDVLTTERMASELL